jgi:alpha-D-ribose 1-methylphosphonate 5-triphosphate diphosphatase
VLDSLRVWREDGAEEVDGRAGILAEAIASARDADLLRADHFLHLRCEIPMPSVVEEARELVGRPDVRLMSLMDHTPGQRQFRDEGKLRAYYRGKGAGMTDAELDTLFERRFAYQKAYAATNMRQIICTRSRWPVTTTPPTRTSLTPFVIVFRWRNFRPRWKPPADCTWPASAS